MTGATESRLDVVSRVVSAAYTLKHRGPRASVAAACKLAGADRKSFARRYPEAVTLIESLGMRY